MTSSFRTHRWTRAEVTILLFSAALLPFVTGAVEIASVGIPDLLFTGDAAALELGVRHAARGSQLVGPYSRFGWNHPGPAIFYLVVPIYELLRERGPSLNVFAFITNAVAALWIVVIARRLYGGLFALVAASLLAVYARVAVPFLLGNEWNPIFPILPLVLLFFVTARLCLTGSGWATFAFIASVIVQTHLGYVPAVVGLLGIALFSRSPIIRSSKARWSAPLWPLTVLAILWFPPTYEALTASPGNIQRLTGFFAFSKLAHPHLTTALMTVLQQMSVMPLAVLDALFHTVITVPPGVAIAIGVGEVVGAIASLLVITAKRNNAARILSVIACVEIVAAVVAVQGIRGEVLFYLVTWTTTVGLLVCLAGAAWLGSVVETRADGRLRAGIAAGAMALLVLAIASPAPGNHVIHSRDDEIERLADAVIAYLRVGISEPITVRIASEQAWPAAAGLVLALDKHAVPIYVETRWLNVLGYRFAEPQSFIPFHLLVETLTDPQHVGQVGSVLIARNRTIGVYLIGGRDEKGQIPRP